MNGPHESNTADPIRRRLTDADLDEYALELTRLAETAAEAVRAINHATITGPALPAPGVYTVLGDLKRIGYGMAQATGQLAARLADSARVFDLYECEGRDPGEQIAAATTHLTEAAEHARAFGVLLDTAQTAMGGRGPQPRKEVRDISNVEDLALLVTPEEAASRLEVGRSKVYELMRKGELPSLKIGGSRRITTAALSEFVFRMQAAS